jgi:hypothetical protein
LVDAKGDTYDVIFYLSRRPVPSHAFGEQLMTPVIFRDDRVYAIGRYSLKKLRAGARAIESTAVVCQRL